MSIEGYHHNFSSDGSFEAEHTIDLTESIAGIREGVGAKRASQALHTFVHELEGKVNASSDHFASSYPSLSALLKGEAPRPRKIFAELKKALDADLVDPHMAETLLKGLNFKKPVASYGTNQLRGLIKQGIVFLNHQDNIKLIRDAIERKSQMGLEPLPGKRCSPECPPRQKIPTPVDNPKSHVASVAETKESDILLNRDINSVVNYSLCEKEAFLEGEDRAIYHQVVEQGVSKLDKFTDMPGGMKTEFVKHLRQAVAMKLQGAELSSPKEEIRKCTHEIIKEEYLKFTLNKSGEKGALIAEHLSKIKASANRITDEVLTTSPPYFQDMVELISAIKKMQQEFRKLEKGYKNSFIKGYIDPEAEYKKILSAGDIRKHVSQILIDEVSSQKKLLGQVHIPSLERTSTEKIKVSIDEQVLDKILAVQEQIKRFTPYLAQSAQYRVKALEQNNENEVLRTGKCVGSSLSYVITNSSSLAHRDDLGREESSDRFTQAFATISLKHDSAELAKLYDKYHLVDLSQLNSVSVEAQAEFKQVLGGKPKQDESFEEYFLRKQSQLRYKGMEELFDLKIKPDEAVGLCNSGAELLSEMHNMSYEWPEGRMQVDGKPWMSLLRVPGHMMAIGVIGEKPEDKKLVIRDPNYGEYHFPFVNLGQDADDAVDLLNLLLWQYGTPLEIMDVHSTS